MLIYVVDYYFMSIVYIIQYYIPDERRRTARLGEAEATTTLNTIWRDRNESFDQGPPVARRNSCIIIGTG